MNPTASLQSSRQPPRQCAHQDGLIRSVRIGVLLLPCEGFELRSAPVEAWLGRDVADGIVARLQSARPPWGNPNSRRGLNHDLFPRDEFATPVAR